MSDITGNLMHIDSSGEGGKGSTSIKDGNKKEELKKDEQDVEVWSEKVIKISAGWCLLDHPGIWKKLGRTSNFLDSPRLMSLAKNKRKNEIVKLPKAMSVIRRLYCSLCKEIPFPWSVNPNVHVFKDEGNPPGVHLCKNGHAICKVCYKACRSSHCTYSPADTDYVTGKSSLFSKKKLSTISGSKGGDKQKRFCFARFSPPNVKCFFMTDMINASEFACQYFHNFCPFRGRGKGLENHELSCPFRIKSFPSIDEDRGNQSCISSEDDDNDSFFGFLSTDKYFQGEASSVEELLSRKYII